MGSAFRQRFIAAAPVPASPVDPAVSVGDARRVLLGKKLDIKTNWMESIEDPVTHPGNEQPAYSFAGMPDGTLVVNGTRGTYGLRDDGSVAWHLESGYCPTTPAIGPDGTLYVHSALDYNCPDKPLEQDEAQDDGQGMRIVQRRWLVTNESDRTEARSYTATPDGLLLSPRDGDTWNIAWGSAHGRFFPVADGRALMHAFHGGVGLFDSHTSRVEKIYSYRESYPAGVAQDGTSFWWDGRHLRCVAPDLKSDVWTYDCGEAQKGPPHVTVAPEGSVYVMRSDVLAGTEVTALSQDGKFRWTWKPKGGPGWMGETPYLSAAPIFDSQGTAFFSGDKVVYAVGPDGQTRWQRDYPETCNLLQIGPAGTLLACDPSTHLRILSSRDGEPQWQSSFTLGHGYPGTFVRGSTIYTATHDAQLVSIHCADAMEELLQSPPEKAPDRPDASIDRKPEYVLINGVRVPVQR